MSKAIRNWYAEIGVDAYYQQYGKDYLNPHFPYIRALLMQNEANINYNKVLDFCCGNGEVSMVLQEMGYENFVGCDPFTYQNYEQNFQKNCLQCDFDEVIRGKLSEMQFSAVICSFAMHLCSEKKLYTLAARLLDIAPFLLIITPHKRPDLTIFPEFQLLFEDAVLTKERGKQVRLRCYVSKNAINH